MVTMSNTVAEVKVLNGSPNASQHRYGERLFSATSAGVFFVLVGIIFALTPDLFGAILAFFRDFDIVKVPNMRIVYFPAPAVPGTHSVLYSAVIKFSLIWGLFQIVILALRFIVASHYSKKAETASNVVLWLGTSYLISEFLNETTTLTTWFAFWGVFIMLIGASLIIRAIILAVQTWHLR